MVEEMLHYEDINSTTSKAFCKQFNCGEWSPARNLPDSKAPPTGYSANVAETKTWCGTQAKVLAIIQEAGAEKVVWAGTEAEVLALIKQEGGGPKTGVHWSRECKEARRDPGTEASLIGNGCRLQPEHLRPSRSMERLSSGARSASVG